MSLACPLAEFNAPGGTSISGLVRSYTWGLDIVNTMTSAGGVGALLQIADHPSRKTYLPGYDGNGNIMALFDAEDGDLAAAYEYSPFGEPLRAQTFDPIIADNPFRFSTKFTDLETGLVYYGRRYYDPRNGRFINQDPIEEAGGLNLYGFVGNSPVNRWDFLGQLSDEELSDAFIYGTADTSSWTADDWAQFEQYVEDNDSFGGELGDEDSGVDDDYDPFEMTVSVQGIDVGTVNGETASVMEYDEHLATLGSSAPGTDPNKASVKFGAITNVETGAVVVAAEAGADSTGQTSVNAPGAGGRAPTAPNSAANPNANDTLLGRANLFIAQVGGQTADNALNTATIAAIGAQEGLAKHVSFSGEAGVNVMPIIPRSRQYGPHPLAGGLGVGGEINFRDGLGGSANGQLSAGKFGGYGELGITFTIPLSGGNTVGNLGVGGGAGPGGKIQVEFDRNGTPTALKVTIGAGFGFEVGGNLGFPNQPPPKR